MFSGCGGLSLGFQLAGFNLVAAYEKWAAAIDVYTRNFQHPVHMMDLSDDEFASEHIARYTPDIIIGGPPCQDFSSAGLRNEEGGRGSLTVSYSRIVACVRPMWFVMENVPTIIKTHKLVEARKNFSQAGYGLTQVTLNAALCGVPQRRKRFFLVGLQGAPDNFLLETINNQLADKEMTVRDYLGDKIEVEYYYRHPRSYARRGVFSIDEPSPTIRGVNRPVPNGYTSHAGDPVTDFSKIRPLTTRERGLIQTFPDDFVFGDTKSASEQMIGNAVPVNLGRFVATAIRVYAETHNFWQ